MPCLSIYTIQSRPLVVHNVLSVNFPYAVLTTDCLHCPVCQCTLCCADNWLSAMFYLSVYPIQLRPLVICNVLSVNVPCTVQTTCLQCHVCQYTLYSADKWLSALYCRSIYPVQCRPFVVCNILSVNLPCDVLTTGCMHCPVCQCTLFPADQWLSAMFYLSMYPIQLRPLVSKIPSVNVPYAVQNTGCLQCLVCQCIMYSVDNLYAM